MAMALASCTGSLWSIRLSTGTRSTRNVIPNSLSPQEVQRSKGESTDRTVLLGASASSSVSSVPGISYTEPLLDQGDGGNGFSGGRGGGGGGGGGGGDNGHGGSESSGAGQGGSSIGGGGIFNTCVGRYGIEAELRDELDLVFSTVVVGSILNFTLMFGTLVYKAGQFAVVGFVAGLVGTFLSTSLLNARKKMDPDFVIQNEAPPTFLNASTWAIHMGLSSNIRYQTINGLEFAMAKALPAGVFKTLVFLIRGCNNVLGGTSFVILARLAGSQPREGTPPTKQKTEEGSSLEHARTS